MNLLNFDIYFKVQKKRCEFKITSLEIDFWPNFCHVIYENRIFLSLKILQKNLWKRWFLGLFFLFFHVWLLIPSWLYKKYAGWSWLPLGIRLFFKKVLLHVSLKNSGNKKIWNGWLLLPFQILFFSLCIDINLLILHLE